MPSPFRSWCSMPRPGSPIPAPRRRRSRHRRPDQTKYIEDPCDASHLKRHGRGRHQEHLAEGNSSQPTGRFAGNGLVESWLAHVKDPVLDSSDVSPRVAGLLTPHHRPPRQGGADIITRPVHPAGQEAPGGLHGKHAHPPPPVNPARRSLRRHSRRPSISDSSSILSADQYHGAAYADPSPPRRRAYADDETPSQDLWEGLDASDEQSSSCMSALPPSSAFEKRPRHKTRPDRYETKKHEQRPRDAGDEARLHGSRKRRKDGRNKAVISSKNVMGNFTTNTVLNNHLTVSTSSQGDRCFQAEFMPRCHSLSSQGSFKTAASLV